ncbi:unnamed protein product [Vitrella brassicaformis CCMP3155]|uniref:Uncharacterized protein n=1 Tax=Vitrella brassicaformis (strain CCMP3155) TaxID=1169540 RepID=A0A0G4GKC9_VITBC|nr:unnamed protein product [Vitrella brassicaformis CCMP3155]|eukprot:CEM30437.1 unnamed protein product [Vitrella brassicaformis CCMP3155]
MHAALLREFTKLKELQADLLDESPDTSSGEEPSTFIDALIEEAIQQDAAEAAAQRRFRVPSPPRTAPAGQHVSEVVAWGRGRDSVSAAGRAADAAERRRLNESRQMSIRAETEQVRRRRETQYQASLRHKERQKQRSVADREIRRQMVQRTKSTLLNRSIRSIQLKWRNKAQRLRAASRRRSSGISQEGSAPYTQQQRRVRGWGKHARVYAWDEAPAEYYDFAEELKRGYEERTRVLEQAEAMQRLTDRTARQRRLRYLGTSRSWGGKEADDDKARADAKRSTVKIKARKSEHRGSIVTMSVLPAFMAFPSRMDTRMDSDAMSSTALTAVLPTLLLRRSVDETEMSVGERVARRLERIRKREERQDRQALEVYHLKQKHGERRRREIAEEVRQERQRRTEEAEHRRQRCLKRKEEQSLATHHQRAHRLHQRRANFKQWAVVKEDDQNYWRAARREAYMQHLTTALGKLAEHTRLRREAMRVLQLRQRRAQMRKQATLKQVAKQAQAATLQQRQQEVVSKAETDQLAYCLQTRQRLEEKMERVERLLRFRAAGLLSRLFIIREPPRPRRKTAPAIRSRGRLMSFSTKGGGGGGAHPRDIDAGAGEPSPMEPTAVEDNELERLLTKRGYTRAVDTDMRQPTPGLTESTRPPTGLVFSRPWTRQIITVVPPAARPQTTPTVRETTEEEEKPPELESPDAPAAVTTPSARVVTWQQQQQEEKPPILRSASSLEFFDKRGRPKHGLLEGLEEAATSKETTSRPGSSLNDMVDHLHQRLADVSELTPPRRSSSMRELERILGPKGTRSRVAIKNQPYEQELRAYVRADMHVTRERMRGGYLPGEKPLAELSSDDGRPATAATARRSTVEGGAKKRRSPSGSPMSARLRAHQEEQTSRTQTRRAFDHLHSRGAIGAQDVSETIRAINKRRLATCGEAMDFVNRRKEGMSVNEAVKWTQRFRNQTNRPLDKRRQTPWRAHNK